MMQKKQPKYKPVEDLQKQLEEQGRELEELRLQLDEAHETIEAIRTGQVDALVVQGDDGHQLYTLRTADQTYRVFIEKMAEGAVALNQEGIIVYSNTQFSSMVERPLSNVIGVPFREFIAQASIPIYETLFESSWNSDAKGELLLLSANGNTPIQLSLTTLELAEGLSLSVIVTDLSYQKDIQEQLEKNNKKLEEANRQLESSNHDLQQFASVASHDLQEPLRKIQVFSTFLKYNETELSAESQKNLDKIISSSARMKTLIIDILNYSRLSVKELNVDRVDLNAVVNDLVEDFELVIQEKGAQVHSENLPCIEANKGQIRQIFQNIISNAIKFSQLDIPPVISIRSKKISDKSFESREDKDGAFCLITIEDNGIGFDEHYVSNIFALFERLNTKDKYEGTGIGMAIAKKIVEKHNGLITATGKEGSGSTFKIILPIKQSLV